MKRLVAIAALALAIAFRAAGSEVQLTPAADVQKALDAAAPGDTIVLSPGVYYQNLVMSRGGTPGKPVTLRAAKGGGATISGAVAPGEDFAFNIVFLDDDGGKGYRYWLQLAPGLCGRSAASPRYVLAK